MKLEEIIFMSDELVPNEVPVADKVIRLNAINQDFFNVVKIPRITMFDCITAQPSYTLPADVRSKNIDLVMSGMFRFMSLERDPVTPGQNAYRFEDKTSTLTLLPAPFSDQQGVVRYRMIATTSFTVSDLQVEPDAPPEFHWTYVPALAAYIANTQDDSVKAANYENEYKAAWNVAAQNYQGGVAR